DATVFQSEESVGGNLVGFGSSFGTNTAAGLFIDEYQLDETDATAFEGLYTQAVSDTVAGIGSTVQFNANYTTPVVVAETFLSSTTGYDVTSITGTIGTDLQIAVLTVNIWVEG